MNCDEIKWISYYGKDTGTICQSCNDKVKRFDFCLVLDEYGSDKASKAQLSILDVVRTKATPNILLICPGHLMHSWYRDIVTRSGVDFKMISGSSRAITYFSADMSNMFILSEDALLGDGCLPKKEGFVWDLVIIDASLNISGINSSLYIENIGAKTQKLLVFSPVPCAYTEDYGEIKTLVKALLADSSKASAVDNLIFSKQTICFDPDSPVMRYYDNAVYDGQVARNVVVEKYTFDDEFLSGIRRLVDLKTGLPLYPYGGNIFEEYAIEEKKIYTKPAYNMADVQALRAVDKKLDCFLNKLDSVISSSVNKVIVYCVSSATAEYLKKVLSVLYPELGNALKVDKGDIFNTRYLSDGFDKNKSSDNAKVVITVDSIQSINRVMKEYTHIFNYELPDSPVILEQRAARHGGKNETDREFIVFRDTNGKFDTRVLSKVLFGKIYKSIVAGLPGRNVLFDIPEAIDLIVDCIKDLQYVCGYTGEVSASMDVVTRFRGEYNVIPSVDLSNSQKTREYTKEKLDKIYRAFGIQGSIKDNSTDAKLLRQLIRPVLESFKNSLLYLSDEQRIIPISGDELKECLYSVQYNEYKQKVLAGELTAGLKKAQESLGGFITEGKNVQLRECVKQLPDGMKMPVLLNSWRYLTDAYIIQDTFREFMKTYNEGVK